MNIAQDNPQAANSDEVEEKMYVVSDLEEDTLRDFIAALSEDLIEVEKELLIIEKEPTEEAINSLFRSIHTVKGNCRMCCIDPFTDYTHSIEELLSEVRARKVKTTHLLKEALLIALDYIRLSSELMLQSGTIEMEKLHTVSKHFRHMATLNAGEIDVEAATVIKLIGGESVEDLVMNSNHHSAMDKPLSTYSKIEAEFEDIQFFKTLSQSIDHKSPYWDNRAESLLRYCINTNNFLNNPIDPQQLATAVYLHDWGMVFIRDELINKHTKLNAFEEQPFNPIPN